MEARRPSEAAFTSEQQRVFDWLESDLDLPVFAEAYKAAVDLLQSGSSGYITLVSHIGRDFMNILPKVATEITHSQIQYQQRLANIRTVWRSDWGDRGLSLPSSTRREHLIPDHICQKVKDLLDDDEASSEPESRPDFLFFRTFFEYDDLDRVPQNFLQEWKSARRWFLKHMHLREGAFADNASSEVRRHFETLEGLLHAAASNTFERLKGVNEILEETNQ